MRDAGKGDKQRPTDQQKFQENFDRIFGKKPQPQEKPNERTTPQ